MFNLQRGEYHVNLQSGEYQVNLQSGKYQVNLQSGEYHGWHGQIICKCTPYSYADTVLLKNFRKTLANRQIKDVDTI